MGNLRNKLFSFLKKSEKYTKTDMTYMVSGGFWLTSGQIMASSSSLILAIAFANLLSPDSYGVYKYILSIISIIAITSLGGIDTSVTQSTARSYEGNFLEGIKVKIVGGLVGSIIGFVLAFYYYHQDNTIISFSLMLACVFVPFMYSFDLYNAFLNGRKLYKTYSICNIATQITVMIIMICAILITHNIPAIIGIYFATNTLINLFFLIVTIKKYKPNKDYDEKSLTFGKHMTIMDIVNTLSTQLDKILVFHFLGGVELAIYSIISAPAEQMKGLLKSVSFLSFPKFATRSMSEIKSNIFSKLFKFGVLTTFIVFFYIILVPFLFSIFFPKYAENTFYAQLYAISIIASILGTVLYTILTAKALTKELYQYNFLSNLVTIGLLFILTYHFGIIGAVSARIISRYIILAFLVLIIKRTN